ncbi:hypothetical protein [Microbacterium halotolerans]|uniref:hypothetical protein n=1 Tax=Microbacterium halotolerans TaxID=246613 RepID=UPI000E6ACF42|nr:hypothetical protein [Microbacterium halotolerans]
MTSDPETEPEPDFEHADIDPVNIAGFAERLLERDWNEEEFELDGVQVQTSSGIWIVMLGAYVPPEGEATAQEQEEMSAALTWVEDARLSAQRTWGEPMAREPQVSGEDDAPEGVIDMILLALGLESAELWDRGARFVAMLTGWQGEPGVSQLVQAMLVLPREIAMGGLTATLPDDATEQELLMHGETLGELHRRAAILSTLFSDGEARLHGAPMLATRCSLQSRTGETTVWIFTEDGRALLLIRHPDVTLDDGTAEGELAASRRLLDGVPDDLLACIAAAGERPDGAVAQHALEFGLLGDAPVPRITGVFWFDGSTWRVTRGLLEIAVRDGLGMDDLGFRSTVRQPFRLGGTFDAGVLSPHGDSDEELAERARVERLFAACPYPPGPRPEGDRLLGYAIPHAGARGAIVDDIERVCEQWWTHSDDDAGWNDLMFNVGGRTLDGDGGRTLTTILAESEQWYLDEFAAWSDGLFAVMSERWGDPFHMRVRDRSGAVRRTPVTRVMRAAGFEDAPGWWVNGHAVMLLAGTASERSIGVPSVMLVIATADAVLDPMEGTTTWALRGRARVLGSLAGRENEPISWNGPVLAGSEIVPDATRGGVRTDFATWAWHFTHDGRGVLLSCTNEFAPDPAADDAYQRLADLFDGVPDDLLSLVLDRDPAGLYDVMRRQDGAESEMTEGGALAAAQSVPVVTGVYWSDGTDWRASDGLLRRARSIATDGDPNGNPLEWITSAQTGLRALTWVLCAGRGFDADVFTAEPYTDFVFGGPVDPDAAQAAMDALLPALDAAHVGSLNDLLDIVSNGPGHRFLLDAALSNSDPRSRREIALWLLEEGADPSTQLSFLTPVNVLLENRTLDADDAVLLRRLVASRAAVASTTFGATAGGHALVQLCDLDVDEAVLEPLYAAILDGLRQRTEPEDETPSDSDESAEIGLLQTIDDTLPPEEFSRLRTQADDAAEASTPVENLEPPLDAHAPALRDGRSVLDYVSEGAFPHARSRSGLLSLLTELSS